MHPKQLGVIFEDLAVVADGGVKLPIMTFFDTLRNLILAPVMPIIMRMMAGHPKDVRLLVQDPAGEGILFETRGFICNRTWLIRQDSTLQNNRGPITIECHERIACHHMQSLNEFYDNYWQLDCLCPNQAVFRAYYLLTHLRDSDAARATERLPEKVFSDERLQSTLQLQNLVQCGNSSRAAARRPANLPATLNGYTLLIKKLGCPQSTFLNACLLQTHFSEIRGSALKALRSAQSCRYGTHVPLVKIARLKSLEEFFGFCTACSLTMLIIFNHTVTFRTGPSVLVTQKMSGSSTNRDNQNTPNVEDASPPSKKKRKADQLAELRLLVNQTREGLISN
ncbi:hypothetical protein MJO28_002025 [Puccinia striiformis f. sp. tritici]|uniref:Uncharacterized protein n=1 Tax=Puccinia striiformis f. sp. tritici TaxID=168172 RepID=A0ACC0EWP6_9BASI|nr:hypothetical protein MJO28_002025 [Puccinia striiformis f. sp. tritici]